MKIILTPNPSPPFNLMRIHYAASLREMFNTEDGTIIAAIHRNKEVGVIPCETEVERKECLRRYKKRHPKLPPIDLPPVGPHWVVDEIDLPGGSISEDNDWFFDAWEWVAGRVEIDMPKARTAHRHHMLLAKRTQLSNIDEAIEMATGAELVRLRSEGAALRDFHIGSFDLDSYPTPEVLKAAWPVELQR